MRVAYLGPAGTFSEDAVRSSGFAGEEFEPLPCSTVAAVIEAIGSGAADRAMAPIDNSIEGSVRHTVDGLIERADSVRIVGEYVHEIRSALIAAEPVALSDIKAVTSHPQPLAQCSRFLREELPGAELRFADSTSSAVREVSDGETGLAALGPAAAAELYGCTILREGIEDEPGNLTRFVWLAPVGTEPVGETDAAGADGSWGRRMEDHGRFLRARRGPPRLSGRSASRILQTAHQPRQDRIQTPTASTWSIPVLRRHRRPG